MKKLLCFVLAVIMMLGLVGCGSEDVEGTWLSKDKENQRGYSFETLLEDKNGEKVGYVSILPSTSNYLGVRYLYKFIGDDQIQITKISASFSGDSIGADETEYDVLTLETEDGERVLVSTKNETKYYFTENEN